MNIDIKKVKIITTTPTETTKEIIMALGDVGAGIIGNYSYCSTYEQCVGTFKGSDETNPYVGEKNKFETVSEEKISMVCNIELAREVINKLREIHPYEEPSIEIVPLIMEEDL